PMPSAVFFPHPGLRVCFSIFKKPASRGDFGFGPKTYQIILRKKVFASSLIWARLTIQHSTGPPPGKQKASKSFALLLWRNLLPRAKPEAQSFDVRCHPIADLITDILTGLLRARSSHSQARIDTALACERASAIDCGSARHKLGRAGGLNGASEP